MFPMSLLTRGPLLPVAVDLCHNQNVINVKIQISKHFAILPSEGFQLLAASKNGNLLCAKSQTLEQNVVNVPALIAISAIAAKIWIRVKTTSFNYTKAKASV